MSHPAMLPSDTARRSARRKPDLNINTTPPSVKSRPSRDPIPHTPPASLPPPTSSKPKRALRAPSARDTADIETFLDSLTPVDMSNKENDRPDPYPTHHPRDSHDLSLPARQVTRDSLVTNMLLSLDQLSMGQISGPFGSGGGAGPRAGFDDPAIFGSDDRNFTSRSGRANGHGYSYSSDLEGADDASRISSRGRRSNSSSGFQSSLGRINSMRETTHQRSGPGTPKPLHSRGGRGSKSSSTNSIDAGYVQVLSSQRWARGFGRSSSFDGGEPPRPQPAPVQASPWHIEFSNSFFNDDYDAAPNPTVPAGPRRLATVPSLPVLPPPEPKTEPKSPGRGPVVERRRSTRSSRSATLGRKDGAKFAGARDVPPVPALDLDSAPAPHVGYEKSKEMLGTPAMATPPAKEKPGFFRRMFGGSSKTNLTSTTSSSTVETPLSKSNFSTPTKSPSAPPSRESHHSTTHTLQKKTSAFFRRRKPSITDTGPPPIPTIPAVSAERRAVDRVDALSPRAEPSPVTSLRRAMDPFLQTGPVASPLSQSSDPMLSPDARLDAASSSADRTPRAASPDLVEAERRRNNRGFSPDYEPSPRAVIRSVDPDSGEDSTGNRRPIETPNRQPPEPPRSGPAKSFLQDNSDSEDSPKRVRKPSPVEKPERNLKPFPDVERRRSPSPTVSKSKSVPNLARSRESVRVSSQQDLKHMPSLNRSDKRDSHNLGLPIEGVLSDGSQAGSYKHVPSLPSLRVESAEPSPKGESVHPSSKSIDEPEIVVGDPTEDDRLKAQKIYDGNEDFIQKDRAAAWMGEEGTVRQRTLRAYMDLYDFENQNIVSSLRQVCQRLLLRAETQQVDRILVAFARRWCDCNPNHGFKASDIIHTICYSIILLNTDLHMADIEHKMTRSQFIKNTMTTIRQALQDLDPDAFDRSKNQNLGPEGNPRTSEDHDRHNSFRASFKPPPRPGSAIGAYTDSAGGESCGPLVKAPFEGSQRAWESQVELVLKDIYASIRDDRLPLFGAETTSIPTPGGLTVMGMLKRTPSVLSKAPSEGVGSTRGRISENARPSGSRWNSKSRSRPRGFGTGFSSSRTSFDDGQSVWSPTESSATWSRASLGRTHTSMSMDSFGSSYPRGDYQQSIGFANALSQAIIREDQAGDMLSIKGEEIKSEQLLEDDSLELAGPPWIKEGIVTHKHHLDGMDKRAKDRNWTEVFAVIQKGQLSLFSFSPNKSLRNKNRLRSQGSSNPLQKGAVVGGGNWQENATNLGTFSLRQTLASALPPPGYSRSRPHVWALSLPTGAVHLFQVGTPEISKEFVMTANYWSARLSTHPLVGGISNIEYGWSDAIINNALVSAINESSANLPGNRPGTSMSSHKGHSRPGSSTTAMAVAVGRSSMQSQSRGSIRSGSFDFPRPGSGSSGVLGGSVLPRHHHHAKLPGDRVHIAEWAPPTQSLRGSNMKEKEQLESLLAYVRSIEQELQVHNGLRSPMLLAFTPRGGNAAKAMANWERKSEYLLREIVKFRTYVDCLAAAEGRRREVYAERERARRAARGEEEEDELEDGVEGDGEGERDGEVTEGETEGQREREGKNKEKGPPETVES
ncbi:Cytohesin-4 [Echria macrotheca]|uniref:Cytohesin-4 n=1 Tax=Echria macrotheca TaxID=438768 RepID=A0AAJ0B8P8_9PEZI|nr:Cytohesin-4 [Echria macrotheca]